MLTNVVDEHGATGNAAADPGYTVAGKTGTAQKPGPNGYTTGKYVASFVGMVPVAEAAARRARHGRRAARRDLRRRRRGAGVRGDREVRPAVPRRAAGRAAHSCGHRLLGASRRLAPGSRDCARPRGRRPRPEPPSGKPLRTRRIAGSKSAPCLGDQDQRRPKGGRVRTMGPDRLSGARLRRCPRPRSRSRGSARGIDPPEPHRRPAPDHRRRRGRAPSGRGFRPPHPHGASLRRSAGASS